MGFTLIHNLAPATGTVPLMPEGARISARSLAKRKCPGELNRYIKVELGAKLATAIALHQKRHRVHVLFGERDDAGKIAISPDNDAGFFACDKRADGSYVITINEKTATDLFRLDFETFAVEKVDVQAPPGMSKKAIISAPAAFL